MLGGVVMELVGNLLQLVLGLLNSLLGGLL